MSRPVVFARASVEMEQMFHDLSPPAEFDMVRAADSQTAIKVQPLSFLREIDGVLYSMPCRAHIAMFVGSDKDGDVLHIGLTVVDVDENVIGSVTLPIDRKDVDKVGGAIAGLFGLADQEQESSK